MCESEAATAAATDRAAELQRLHAAAAEEFELERASLKANAIAAERKLTQLKEEHAEAWRAANAAAAAAERDAETLQAKADALEAELKKIHANHASERLEATRKLAGEVSALAGAIHVHELLPSGEVALARTEDFATRHEGMAQLLREFAGVAEALAGETAAELAETALTAAVGPSKFVVVLRFAFSAFLLSFVLGRVRAVLAARAERRRSSFNSFAAMGAQEAPPSKADSTVIDVPSTPVPAPAPPKPAPPPPKPGTVEPPPKKKKRVLDIFRKKATRPV